jgi:phage host-nuclease inhibitor protein Gam
VNKNIRLLERTYLLILVAIFLLIVFTPYMIHAGFTVFEEQLVEVATILLLFATGYAVLSLYRKEVTRNLEKIHRLMKEKGALENRLADAFKYIGTVNIQIKEIKSVFSSVRKFPENKKDFGYILQFLADRTLSMVNTGWVLFRIIDTQSLNSLGEYSETRGNSVLPRHKISNKALVSTEKLKGFTVVESGQENFYIKTFCIIPKVKLSRENLVFIKAIVNQLEMLFLIFTSIYYRESHSDKKLLPSR